MKIIIFSVLGLIVGLLSVAWWLFSERGAMEAENRALSESPCQGHADNVGVWSKFYDGIICIENLRQLYEGNPDGGWRVIEVQKDSSASFTLRSLKQNTIVAATVGEFNRGKSHLLSKLAKTRFPSSLRIRTEGISLKALEVQRKTAIFIDTKGMNSKVPVVTDQLLQDKKSEEELLRDVVFDIAQVWLYVVGELSAKEQLEIYQLSRDIAEGRKGQKQVSKIFVVHNLKEHDTMEKINDYKAELKRAYSSGLYEETELVLNQELHYFAGKPNEHTMYMENQFHVILGKESTAGSRDNELVYEFLRMKMVHNLHGAAFSTKPDMWEMLRSSIDRILPKYVFLPPTESKGRATIQIGEFEKTAISGLLTSKMYLDTSKLPSNEKEKITLRYRDLGYFVSKKTTLRHNGIDESSGKRIVTKVAVPGLTSTSGIRWSSWFEPRDEGVPGYFFAFTVESWPPESSEKQEPMAWDALIEWSKNLRRLKTPSTAWNLTSGEVFNAVELHDGIVTVTLPTQDEEIDKFTEQREPSSSSIS